MKSLTNCCILGLLVASLAACDPKRDTEQISTESPTTRYSTNPEEGKTPMPKDSVVLEPQAD